MTEVGFKLTDSNVQYALNLNTVFFAYAADPCEHNFSLAAVCVWLSYTKFTGELDFFSFFIEKNFHKKITGIKHT